MANDTYSILPGRPDIAGNPILAQEERLRRKRALLTEQQRRVAEGIGALPEGQMVSGHYVAPNITEMLHKGIVEPYSRRKAAERTEKELDAGEASLRTQIEAEAEKAFATGRDTERPVAEGQAGPPEPVKGDRVAMARRLQQLPGYQQLGQQVLGDEILQAPIRAEAQAEKRLARADALEAKKADLEARMEDSRLNREQRDAAARELRELQREIAGQASADRRFLGGLASADRRAAIDAKGAKPVPVKVVQDLGELEQAVDTFSRLKGSFKPEFSGLGGAVKRAAGSFLPGGSPTADWWRDYELAYTLPERNRLFGASMTATEKAAWERANITPAMSEDTIKRNLATQEKLRTEVFNRNRERFIKAGYGGVEDAFQPRAGAPRAGAGGGGGGWKVEKE